MVLDAHVELLVFRAGGLFIRAVAYPAEYLCVALGRKGIAVRSSHYFARFVLPLVIDLACRRQREHGKNCLFPIRDRDPFVAVSFHIQIRDLQLLQRDQNREQKSISIFRICQLSRQIIGRSLAEILLDAVPVSPIVHDLIMVSVIDHQIHRMS